MVGHVLIKESDFYICCVFFGAQVSQTTPRRLQRLCLILTVARGPDNFLNHSALGYGYLSKYIRPQPVLLLIYEGDALRVSAHSKYTGDCLEGAQESRSLTSSMQPCVPPQWCWPGGYQWLPGNHQALVVTTGAFDKHGQSIVLVNQKRVLTSFLHTRAEYGSVRRPPGPSACPNGGCRAIRSGLLRYV